MRYLRLFQPLFHFARGDPTGSRLSHYPSCERAFED